ncbi:hypothetical protein X777_10260, partial [Ooceraea biroi]
VNGEIYRDFLEHNLPILLENVPLHIRRNMIYQHDGAPTHSSRNVWRFLDATYPNRWIGRGGPQHWPARSPDLTPLDFFLWGHLKNFIYREPVRNREELHHRIVEAVASISPEMIRNAQQSLLRRARICIDANGAQFEHLL